jgi:hypothetical protein
VLAALTRELAFLPQFEFDSDKDDDGGSAGDDGDGGGDEDGDGGGDEDDDHGLIGARARRKHRQKLARKQQRARQKPQDEGEAVLKTIHGRVFEVDDGASVSTHSDASQIRNRGRLMLGSCSENSSDRNDDETLDDEEPVIQSERRAPPEPVADAAILNQSTDAGHAPVAGLGQPAHALARAGPSPPAARKSGPVLAEDKHNAAYHGGDEGESGAHVHNFLLNADAVGIAGGARAAPLQRSDAFAGQAELTSPNVHLQRPHSAGGAVFRPRAAAAADDARYRCEKRRRVAHGAFSDGEGGVDDVGDKPAQPRAFDEVDACDVVGPAATPDLADKLAQRAARQAARRLRRTDRHHEAMEKAEKEAEDDAACGSGGLSALFEEARAWPWAEFDTPRCLREAGQLLSRLSRQPAELCDDPLEPNEAHDDIDAPAAASRAPFRLRTCDDVRAGVALLLLLAQHLPVAQVVPQVVGRLARVNGAGALIDFRLSCTTARAIVISGMCRLLYCMAGRGCPLAGVANGVSDCIAVLVSEYEDLQKLRATLGARRRAETIGSLHLPEATDDAIGARRQEAVEQRLVEDKQLLRYALLYATGATLKFAQVPGISSLLNVGMVAKLLDPHACAFVGDVRNAALKLVYAAAARVSKSGSEPVVSMDMDDDVFAARAEELRQWNANAAERDAVKAHAEALCTGVLPSLLALMEAVFPCRALPRPAGAPLPTFLPTDNVLAENVPRVFAAVLAAGLHSKALTWPDVERNLLLPHAPAVFWRRAGPFPRELAAQLMAHVLGKATDAVHTAVEAAALIRAWVITLADNNYSDSRRSRIIAYKATIALQRCSLTAPLLPRHDFLKWKRHNRDEWALRRVAAVDEVAAIAAAGQLPPPLLAAPPLWAGALIDAVEQRCASACATPAKTSSVWLRTARVP